MHTEDAIQQYWIHRHTSMTWRCTMINPDHLPGAPNVSGISFLMKDNLNLLWIFQAATRRCLEPTRSCLEEGTNAMPGWPFWLPVGTPATLLMVTSAADRICAVTDGFLVFSVLLLGLILNFRFIFAEVCRRHITPTVGAVFFSSVLLWRGHREQELGGVFTQHFRRIERFLVWLANMDLQTISSFEDCITMVTWICNLLSHWLPIGGVQICMIFLWGRCSSGEKFSLKTFKILNECSQSWYIPIYFQKIYS